jgi:hypothetical protein
MNVFPSFSFFPYALSNVGSLVLFRSFRMSEFAFGNSEAESMPFSITVGVTNQNFVMLIFLERRLALHFTVEM